MNPPTHSPRPPANVPADHTPPLTVSRDTLAQACARALNAPVQLIDIGAGGYVVQPLHFHRLIANGRARVKISPFHSEPITLKGGQDNV
ncbi:hypothetical protein ACIPPQ_20285 [Sphingopyxis sp. LARHCG72]